MQSSFLIFVRNGHSSWSPRAAGRKAVAVTNGGALAAARPYRGPVVHAALTLEDAELLTRMQARGWSPTLKIYMEAQVSSHI